LARKYGGSTPDITEASRLIVLTDWDDNGNTKEAAAQVREVVAENLKLEIWPRNKVYNEIEELFGVRMDAGTSDPYTLREAVDDLKGRHAFGEDWKNDLLQSSLLWHFGYWKLKKLYARHEQNARMIFPPGLYPNVVAVLADLSSFSAFVRDTRDMEVLRHSLTAFYHKARYEIINSGGMMYQFVGDEVVGLFGVPERSPQYITRAMDCARALVDIGKAVANDWQRQIDRIQLTSGAHVGIAMGDMQFVSLRPYGAARLGCVGDSINMGARLLNEADSSEIVVSNTFYQRLEDKDQREFEQLAPVQAKNMGNIRAWKMRRDVGGEKPI
ncbi:MAG: adenylate/guanylate cyclase domain-containing protein, partial [Gammaproteobacteria bacterium]